MTRIFDNILAIVLCMVKDVVVLHAQPDVAPSQKQLENFRLPPGPRLPNPRIVEISAMCRQDGITAQIMFERPFFGMIYSSRYANVHECVYYNSYDMGVIMFSVPNYKCGTQVSRDPSSNVIKTIENEVYVQFDKETQGPEDRRYLFVCTLTGGDGRSTRPGSGGGGSANGDSPDFRGTTSGFNRTAGDTSGGGPNFSVTLRPEGQTVIVHTAEPTRIVVTGGYISSTRPSIFMEIQDGVGPNRPPVRRTLNLGDTVTLVVTGKSPDSGAGLNRSFAYDMFVHSCSANDGAEQNKIELIDQQGCTVRPQVAGRLQRSTTAGNDIQYFVQLKAFKFPTSENVYFTCSVDVCAAGSSAASGCRLPEICASGSPQGVAPQRHVEFARSRRASLNTSTKEQLLGDVPMHQTVSKQYLVSDSIRINELWSQATASAVVKHDSSHSTSDDPNSASANSICLPPVGLGFILAAVFMLTTALVAQTVFLVRASRRLRKLNTSDNGSGSASSAFRSTTPPSPPSCIVTAADGDVSPRLQLAPAVYAVPNRGKPRN